MLNPKFWVERWGGNPAFKHYNTNTSGMTGSPGRSFREFDGMDIYPWLAEYRELLKTKRNRVFYDGSGGEIVGWRERLDVVDRFLQDDLWTGYGLVVAETSLKFLPVAKSFFNEMEPPRDLDRNQLSGLDPGDQVIILKKMTQNGYFPVISERGFGWVLSRDIALGSKELTAAFQQCRLRRVVVDSKAELLSPDGITSVSMGCSFPAYPNREEAVLLPKRQPGGRLAFGKGRIVGESVSGPLPPCVETCIVQAFKYLGCHYAWGDETADGRGRDCSRFVKDVLATMGIITPRNSQEQLKAGKRRLDLRGCSPDERRRIIGSLSPGNLLFTDSHVMIYLGAIGPSFYIIHACYQFKELISGETDRKIKQVVVSDLSLGEGTSAGSLLNRLTGIVEVFY